MNKAIKRQLAPSGVLRAGINMANFLLVSGETSTGEPSGVSPDMAKAIADQLGVALELVPYTGPGEVADAAAAQDWDIANIAAEAERAKTICFSPAYCEIQATYLLPANSAFHSVDDVDKDGVQIAVKHRAAYDLWLTDNLRNASLLRSDTMEGSLQLFIDKKLDALAGLRPRLLEDAATLAGSRVLDDSFTAVQQSIGCLPGNKEASRFLQEFVQQAITSGLVAGLIEKHKVAGKLSVAAVTGA